MLKITFETLHRDTVLKLLQMNSEQAVSLKQTDKQLVSILKNSPIAFYTCNLDGYISFFNEAAVKLWGRTPEIGKDQWCGSWKMFYANGTPMPLEICPMSMTLQTGKFFDGEEIIIERPDHSIKNVLVYPKPLLDADDIVVGAYSTLVDITKQKQVENSQFLLASIITSSEDAIISKDLRGVITSWNDTATQLFGYTAEEIIGKSVKLLIPKNRHSEEYEILSKISKGEQVRHYETDRVKKDGQIIKISLTISPIRNKFGEIIGASKVARDITEQVAIRKKLKKYTEELETLNKHKDEFMSLASHELKTPLTSAKAYIQLLSKTAERNQKEFELIERAGQSIVRLENLINDLLDIAKIKQGKLNFNMEPLNFRDVIKNSVENIQLLSSTHKIIVNNITDSKLIGDKTRLEQVLNNLLNNAIKYSPDADKVEVEAIEEGNNLIVSVKDYGIGVSDDTIEHLIERYYRVDNDSVRFPGLGIGLFISTEILKWHQGKILIESELNKGSTFSFILPLKRIN